MGAIKQLESSPPFVAELADKINELVLTANKVEGIKAGTGITLTVSEGGIMVSASGTGTGGTVESTTYPFQMTDISVGATLKVSIRQGTVNGVYPTGMNATTPKEFTITATTTFYLKVVGTFGAPDTYAVTIETTAVTESITGTGFVSGYAIGAATVSSGAIVSPMNQLVFKSLGVESAGSENMWW